MSPAPSDVGDLIQRLSSGTRSVRCIAAMDLAQLGGEQALAALLAHLPFESDEKTAILIVRRLAEASYLAGIPVLAKLRDDISTPIRLFHAAVLAHDRLERAKAGRQGDS